MPTWAFKPVLPSASVFSGQIVYQSTNINFPNTMKKYVDSVRIFRNSNYANKYTGFETKKYKINANSGNDYDIDINIVMVGNLPFNLFQILRNIAVSINGAGMEVQFYDDWITDKQYRGHWVNAGDFVDNNYIHYGASIQLACYEEQAVS